MHTLRTIGRERIDRCTIPGAGTDDGSTTNENELAAYEAGAKGVVKCRIQP